MSGETNTLPKKPGTRRNRPNRDTDAIKKKVAAYLKEADANTVKPATIVELAMTGATMQLIANHLNISLSTFSRHFEDLYAKGRQNGQLKACQTLAELAFDKKNLGALIWWGKQNMGWTEKVESKEDTKIIQEVIFKTSLD